MSAEPEGREQVAGLLGFGPAVFERHALDQAKRRQRGQEDQHLAVQGGLPMICVRIVESLIEK
eukprot:1536924-Prymnesium_polylepis.1